MQNTIIKQNQTNTAITDMGILKKSNKVNNSDSIIESKEENSIQTDTKNQNTCVKNESVNFVEEITALIDNANDIEECANKIADLKTGRFNDLLKIGSILHVVKNSFSESSKSFEQLLKDKRVQLNKSQGYKYADVYKFCIDKKDIFQSAGNIQELGIEKIYMVTKLKDITQQNDTITHLLKENLSVTQLKYVLELLNRNLVSDVNNAYESVKTAIKNKNLNEELLKLGIGKPKTKTNFEDEIQRLKQEIELLKKELAQYKDTEEKINNWWQAYISYHSIKIAIFVH